MKNDGTYFLRFKYPDGTERHFKPEQVHPFTWNGLHFFAHKVLHVTAEGEEVWSDLFYQVTHRASGNAIGLRNMRTIDAAKIEAAVILENAGMGKVKDVLKAVA